MSPESSNLAENGQPGNRLLKCLGGLLVIGAGTVFALEAHLTGIDNAVALTASELLFMGTIWGGINRRAEGIARIQQSEHSQ